MAKQTGAICGAERNLIGEQKLAEGHFLCRKIRSKKTLKFKRANKKYEKGLGEVKK